MIPHISEELKVPKANAGKMLYSPRSNSIKINNPTAKQMKLNITVNLVGGVQAIYYHYVLKLNFVNKIKYWII
jgi:hypothetical protein